MGILETYDFYWNQIADPRTNNLPLIGSPILVPLILFSYLYFVLKCGPEFMKDRKPYSLKKFVQCYNVFQIVANAYLVQQFISAGWFTEIAVFCEHPDYSYNPKPLKISYTIWMSMILKIIDLIETMVFVLRKKNRQISFLHLYHHVTTVLLAWYITKYFPIAMSSFLLVVNCTVHVIMYTYYLLSTFGEHMQKKVAPYKSILTIMQMVQFVVILVQHLQSFVPSCPIAKLPGAISSVNLLINFALFYNFYRKSYVKPAEKKR